MGKDDSTIVLTDIKSALGSAESEAKNTAPALLIVGGDLNGTLFDLLEEEITVQLNKLPAKEKIILTDILEGNRNKEIDRIINLFLDELRDEFILLSPRYWSNKINNKVFIFHGANDSMVPYTESIALSKNIIDSELFISYLYEHRKISSNKGMFFKIKEFWGMIIFFSRFINYNES